MPPIMAGPRDLPNSPINKASGKCDAIPTRFTLIRWRNPILMVTAIMLTLLAVVTTTSVARADDWHTTTSHGEQKAAVTHGLEFTAKNNCRGWILRHCNTYKYVTGHNAAAIYSMGWQSNGEYRLWFETPEIGSRFGPARYWIFVNRSGRSIEKAKLLTVYSSASMNKGWRRFTTEFVLGSNSFVWVMVTKRNPYDAKRLGLDGIRLSKDRDSVNWHMFLYGTLGAEYGWSEVSDGWTGAITHVNSGCSAGPTAGIDLTDVLTTLQTACGNEYTELIDALTGGRK